MGQDINTDAFHLIQRWEGRAGGIPFLITLQVTSQRLMSVSDPPNLSEKFLQEKKKYHKLPKLPPFSFCKGAFLILPFWSRIYGPAQQWLLKASNLGSFEEFFKGVPSLIYLGLFGCCSPNFIALEDLRRVPAVGLPSFFSSPLQMLAKF